jgi:hypothetical protein
MGSEFSRMSDERMSETIMKYNSKGSEDLWRQRIRWCEVETGF